MGTEKFDQRIIYILVVPRTYVASLYHKNLMVMRRSNSSDPIPPPGSPGVRENMRVIKKGGVLEKRVILVIT